MDIADLRLHVGADVAEAEAGLTRLNGQINSLTGSIAAGFGAGIGFGVFEEGIHAITGAVTGSVGAFAQLQETMARVQSFTDIGADSIGSYTKQLVDMSTQGRVSANELAEGLYYIASSGIPVAESMTVMRAVTDAANAGLGNMTDVSRTVVSVLNAYGLSADSATKITDMMAASVKVGTLETDELAKTLGRVVPIAATMGISFDQLLASIVSMSQVGFTGAQAMTAVRGTILALEAPTTQTQKALDAMGMSAQQLTQLIGEQGYGAALKIMMDRTNGNMILLRDLIPNIRALAGSLAQVHDDGNAYAHALDEIDNSSGTVNTALETMSHTLNFQADEFKNNLTAIGMSAGSFLGNAAEPLLEMLNAALPVALHNAGAAVDGLSTQFPEMGQAWTDAVNLVKNGDLDGAFQTMTDGIGTTLKEIVTGIEHTGEQMFGAGFNLVEQVAEGMGSAASGVLTAVVNSISQIIADFLIGGSPPPKGPLTQIKVGGFNTMSAYMDGLKEGTSDLPTIVQTNIADPLSKYIGESVDSSRTSIAGLKTDIAGLGTAADEIQANIDGIKQHFGEALDDLQTKIDGVDRAMTNFTLDTQDAQLKVDAARLGVDIDQAKGDPGQRATLEAKIQGLQLDKDDLSNKLEIDRLNKASAGTIKADQEAVDSKQKSILEAKRSEYNLTDHAKLAELLNQQEITKEQLATNTAAEGYQKAIKDATELPLKQQVTDIKIQQQQTLQPLQEQLGIYKQQKTALDDILKSLQAQASAAGGGGGAGAKGIGVSKPVIPDFQKELDDKIEGMKTAAEKKGGEIGQKIIDGFGAFVRDHMGGEIGAVLGGVLGGIVLGPIGIPIGAALGGFIGQGVQDKLSKLGFNFSDFKTAINREMSTAGAEGAASYSLGIVEAAVKELAKGAGAIITSLLNGIKDHGVDVVSSAGELVGSFVLAIANHRQEIAQGFLTVVGGVLVVTGDITAIFVALGGVAAAGFIKGMTHGAVDLTPQAKQFANDTVNDALNQLKAVSTDKKAEFGAIGAGIIVHIDDGTYNNKGELITSVNKNIYTPIATTLQDPQGLTMAAHNAGVAVSDGLRQGMTDSLPTLKTDSLTFVDEGVTKPVKLALKTGSPSQVMVDIGGDVVSGLSQGISSPDALSKVGTAAGTMAQQAIDAARNMLKSHSRSEEFYGIGGDVVQGLVDGLREHMSTLRDFLKGVMQDLLTDAKNAGAAVAGAIGGAMGAIANPDKKPFFSSQTGQPTDSPSNGGIANIKAYAGGGYVDRPTFAIVGEAGPEIIVPLNQLARVDPYGGRTTNQGISIMVNVNGAVYGVDNLIGLIIKGIQQGVQRGALNPIVLEQGA